MDRQETMTRAQIDAVLGGTDGAPVLESVHRMALQPGDTIVLKYNGPIKRELAAHIRLLMEMRFPGHKCLVLEKNIDIEVLGSGE